MTEEKEFKHSKFAPSASARWLACSGSVTLIPEDTAEGEPSEYAHEGTVCHDIAARCLKNNYTPDAHLGKIVDGVNITQELVDGIQMYIDEVKGITKEIGAKGGKVEFEVDITDDCWGTLDFATWNSELAAFVDLKMGKGVIVDADDNPQLKLYAIGGLKYLQRDLKLSPEKVKLYIIQPRTVNPVRVWETTRAELIRWFQDVVQPAMAKIKAGDTTCTPGSTQCRWCPISATCTSQQDHVLAEAEGAFADFLPATQQGILALNDLAELLPKFDHILEWIKAVKEYAMVEALAGKKIPGYKLVAGRSNRKWGADEKQVVAFLKETAGIEPYVESLITPPAAEKVIGKKKAASIGLDKYITKPPGSPVLVPISDTRPEIGASVEEEFKEFVSEESGVAMDESNIFDSPPKTEAEISGIIFDELSKETAPFIVDKTDDPPPVKKLTAWERLQRGLDKELEDPVGEPSTEQQEEKSLDLEVTSSAEIATGGNVVMKLIGREDAVSPKAGTKRLDVLNMGKGGVTIAQAAKALNCTENMIKMHLRYLNETNGWNVTVYDTGEFVIN